MLYGDSILYSKNNNREKYLRSRYITPPVLVRGMLVSHQAIIVKAKLFEPYNLNYQVVSDHDWLIRMVKKSRDIKYIDRPVVKYLIGGISDRSFLKGWSERIDIVWKHYGAWGVLKNYAYFVRDLIKRTIKNILGVEHLRK